MDLVSGGRKWAKGLTGAGTLPSLFSAGEYGSWYLHETNKH